MLQTLFIWIIYIETVFGHGKLWEPPARSTMWRRGFKTPINPNDNELNCGGFQNHWIKYEGRCGVCGDPYQQTPRPNEAGGKYATGTITRQYQSGKIIDLAVDITANHVGYFEFRVCPNNDFKSPVTQKCLDRYPIFVIGSKDGRYHVGAHQNGIVLFKGRLPRGLMCSQCVLQWRYRTGNRWGCHKKSSKCGKGYGPQEEFYGCSDISIGPVTKKRLPNRKPGTVIKPDKLKSNFKLVSNPSELVNNLIRSKNVRGPVLDKLTNVLWTLLQTIISTNRGSKVALIQWNPIGHDIVELGKRNHLPVLKLSKKKKHAVPSTHWPPSKPTVVTADLGEEKGGPMMLSELVVDDEWRNPAVIRRYSNTPKDFVTAEAKCHATKEFEKVEGTNQWCNINCNAGNCPPVMCVCNRQSINRLPRVISHSQANPLTIDLRNNKRVLTKQLKQKLSKNFENHKLLRILPKRKGTFTKTNQQTSDPKKTLRKSARYRCRGAGKFSTHQKMVGWCVENCSKGFCPKSICTCSKNI